MCFIYDDNDAKTFLLKLNSILHFSAGLDWHKSRKTKSEEWVNCGLKISFHRALLPSDHTVMVSMLPLAELKCCVSMSLSIGARLISEPPGQKEPRIALTSEKYWGWIWVKQSSYSTVGETGHSPQRERLLYNLLTWTSCRMTTSADITPALVGEPLLCLADN